MSHPLQTADWFSTIEMAIYVIFSIFKECSAPLKLKVLVYMLQKSEKTTLLICMQGISDM